MFRAEQPALKQSLFALFTLASGRFAPANWSCIGATG
jgi:hypothetical protein